MKGGSQSLESALLVLDQVARRWGMSVNYDKTIGVVGSNWSLLKIDDLYKFLMSHVRPAVSGRGRTSFYLKAGAG